MEKEMAGLREAAMRLHCAMAYAPVDGVKLSAGLVQLNVALGMALQAVDAASTREVQA